MRESWLRGLAANPSAPPSVLLALLHPDAEVVWEVLCQSRDLPLAVIDAIVTHPSEQIAKYFSDNQEVDPWQLARLLDGPHSLAYPWLVRHRRDRPLPDELIDRLLGIDTPHRLITRRERFEDLLFSQRGYVLAVAARHADPQVRAWACFAWQVLPDQLQQSLLNDPDPLVNDALREAIAEDQKVMTPGDLPERECHGYWHILLNRRLSRELVDQVLAGQQVDRIACLAYNASTPPDVVADLINHPEVEVRGRIAERTDLTDSQLRQLAADPDRTVRTIICTNPQLSETLRDGIDIQLPELETVSWHPLSWLTDLQVSTRNASSVSPLVRRDAARDPRLPTDIARRLAHDGDPGVRTTLCLHHPDAPSDALLRSFLEYTGRDRDRLTNHPNFPTTGLTHLAEQPDPHVRCLVSRDRQAPPAVIDHLTHDSELLVRQAMASCPQLPAQRLEQLLHDPELAQSAAANPALPAPRMQTLLTTVGLAHHFA